LHRSFKEQRARKEAAAIGNRQQGDADSVGTPGDQAGRSAAGPRRARRVRQEGRVWPELPGAGPEEVDTQVRRSMVRDGAAAAIATRTRRRTRKHHCARCRAIWRHPNECERPRGRAPMAMAQPRGVPPQGRRSEPAGRLSVPLPAPHESSVHMHVNRLLRSAHRAQELVLYDLLGQLHASRRQARGHQPSTCDKRRKP